MKKYSRMIIEKIKRNVSLPIVAQWYTKLDKSNIGPCPFHAHPSPSFNVDPLRREWRCDACHKSGDIFALLMQMENISFSKAVMRLAPRAGIGFDELMRDKGVSTYGSK